MSQPTLSHQGTPPTHVCPSLTLQELPPEFTFIFLEAVAIFSLVCLPFGARNVGPGLRVSVFLGRELRAQIEISAEEAGSSAPPGHCVRHVVGVCVWGGAQKWEVRSTPQVRDAICCLPPILSPCLPGSPARVSPSEALISQESVPLRGGARQGPLSSLIYSLVEELSSQDSNKQLRGWNEPHPSLGSRVVGRPKGSCEQGAFAHGQVPAFDNISHAPSTHTHTLQTRH